MRINNQNIEAGIYKISSILDSNIFYIGSSINIKKRWQFHLNQINKNKLKKLSVEDIELIRKATKEGKSQRSLAIDFGVNRNIIAKINNNQGYYGL